jgi:AraC family transcriptional regulator of adaptative response / DNA-3-methyladenine glycosylase II
LPLSVKGQVPAAEAAGDHHSSSDGHDLGLFQQIVGRISDPGSSLENPSTLATEFNLTQSKLDDLFRDHAHLTPRAWFRRHHMRVAAHDLLATKLTVPDLASKFGCRDSSAFEVEFLQHMRMMPAGYRALDATAGFHLVLPVGYRSDEILAYHARDPGSHSERSEGNRIWKALATPDGPAILELELSRGRAAAHVHADRRISRESVALLHGATLRMLGLVNEVDTFERDHRALATLRQGLRVPLLPTGFDALCWAIIGQQINLAFASGLRREIIALAGERVGNMRSHPTPTALANVDMSELTTRRYSRSKARYLIDAAQAVAGGVLDIENITNGSAIAAEAALIAQRGIGVWTARYVLLRSGFADAAPIGDSGLATGLQRAYRLSERPDAVGAARLMARFSPHRSLATAHLWASLKDAA